MAQKYKEAFMLMQYRCGSMGTEVGPIEWLWNSRDGVTPFMVLSVDGKASMQHVDWHDDIPCPQYVPNVGQRVFVDARPGEETSNNVKVVTVTEAMQLVFMREREDRLATMYNGNDKQSKRTHKQKHVPTKQKQLKQRKTKGCPMCSGPMVCVCELSGGWECPACMATAGE